MLLLLATPPLSLDHMQAPAQLHARRSRSYKQEVPAGTPKAAPEVEALMHMMFRCMLLMLCMCMCMILVLLVTMFLDAVDEGDEDDGDISISNIIHSITNIVGGKMHTI